MLRYEASAMRRMHSSQILRSAQNDNKAQKKSRPHDQDFNIYKKLYAFTFMLSALS
jgi:hypothetical protein